MIDNEIKTNPPIKKGHLSTFVFSLFEQMILHAYSGYAKHAWGANEHRPISKTGHSANVFGSHSLGIAIIDSLDTIYLADLKEFLQKSREWIETKFDPKVVRSFSRRNSLLF